MNHPKSPGQIQFFILTDVGFFVHLITFLGIFHIHRKIWADSNPNFELKQYSSTLKNIMNNKAIKTNCVFNNYLI